MLHKIINVLDFNSAPNPFPTSLAGITFKRRSKTQVIKVLNNPIRVDGVLIRLTSSGTNFRLYKYNNTTSEAALRVNEFVILRDVLETHMLSGGYKFLKVYFLSPTTIVVCGNDDTGSEDPDGDAGDGIKVTIPAP